MTKQAWMSGRTARALALPATLFALGLATFLGLDAWLERWAETPVKLTDAVLFDIPNGATFAQVAATIRESGITDATTRLTLRARQRGLIEAIRRGEYRVTPGVTPDGLLDLISHGQVVQHHVRIEEGETVATLLRRLEADERLDFDLSTSTPRSLADNLGIASPHNPALEGRFFPDTYQFDRGHRVSELLGRALKQMDEVLNTAWAGRAKELPYESAQDALVLASLVEKETGRASDRARIAGVFVRRLTRRMRLQSDPTVIYGLGDAFDGNLTRAHLDTDGPYNTYSRHGLPPTPIALPSRDSIHAALHPEIGNALYFVARGDGSSEFSATLEQHNRAVRRFQLGGS